MRFKERFKIIKKHRLGANFFDLTQQRSLNIDTIQVDNADLLIEKFGAVGNTSSGRDSLMEEMQKYNLDKVNEEDLRTEAEILEDIAKNRPRKCKVLGAQQECPSSPGGSEGTNLMPQWCGKVYSQVP